MFCNNCGKEIPDNSEFCQFCGTKNKKGFSENSKLPISSKWWFIVLMLSFVYPFGMFLMWSKKKFNLFFRIVLSVFFFFVFIGVVSGVISGYNESNTTEVQMETKVIETTKTIETTKNTEVKETQATKETKVTDIESIIKFFNDNLLPDIELYNSSIADCGVEMNRNDNYIMINIAVYDSTNNETAMDIADTVVRQLNLAANILDSSKYPIGTKNNYGGLYDEYNAMVGVAPLSKTGNSKEWYIYDAITGGSDMLKLQKH